MFFLLASCTFDHTPLPDNGYPPDVGRIITTQCSTPGCHTRKSKAAAGGLAMETWADLFAGGNGGAVVIPYRPDQSWLMFYTNTDTARGIVLQPTMPFNRPPLSLHEWQTLYNWIINGAKNNKGEIAFPPVEGRTKIYIANQGCDIITVVDAETRLAMRYIDVGNSPDLEFPHFVKVSPDRKFWYIVHLNSTYIEKFNAHDDSRIGTIPIGTGYWNTMAISGDGRYGYVVDLSDDGHVAILDLQEMKIIANIWGLRWPHGSWCTRDGRTLYVTSQYGNYIYKLDVSNLNFIQSERIVLAPGQSPHNFQGTLDPHEVIMTPDETKYFVTCQASDEVRVFDASTDQLIKVIPVGNYPQEMAVSQRYPYLLVTCLDDPCAQPKCRGSLYVINYETLEIVAVVNQGFYQPHGVAVVDLEGYAVVASRNLDLEGPPPHHASNCGGRNGFIQFVDLNTLTLQPQFKTEVSVDPYAVGVR
ncbi:MAG: YncE family protein [Chitinophagales bacterium]|nr:YncE family protein [Chitinophagales bacterium]MDW8428456.1 YncE family protein [Chitinophagales bacterium]